jgi:hypothetical protein
LGENTSEAVIFTTIPVNSSIENICRAQLLAPYSPFCLLDPGLCDPQSSPKLGLPTSPVAKECSPGWDYCGVKLCDYEYSSHHWDWVSPCGVMVSVVWESGRASKDFSGEAFFSSFEKGAASRYLLSQCHFLVSFIILCTGRWGEC